MHVRSGAPQHDPAPVTIDAQSIQLLVLASDMESLTAAARTLGMSQPAASRRIHLLEKQFGFRLLERTPSGSFPTREGASIVEHARSAIDALRTLEAKVAEVATPERAIRVLVSPVVGDQLLPEWLRHLGAKAPRVSVDIRNSPEVLERLITGRADLGFLCVPDIEPLLRDTQLNTRPLARDRLCVAVHPKHPWARRRAPVTIEDLARAELVEREPQSETRAFLDRVLEPHRGGRSPRPLVELSSTSALKRAAMDGVGPAVLGVLTIQSELAEERLASVEVEGFTYDRTLYAVWPTASAGDPAVQQLVSTAERIATAMAKLDQAGRSERSTAR